MDLKEDTRPRILVLISHYLPGHKCGGPVRSVSAFVDRFQSEFDIFLVCQDRDLGESFPYPHIASDTWIPYNGSHIQYVAGKSITFHRLFSLMREIRPEVVYLNSLFSPAYTLAPLIARRLLLPQPGVVLAPRGTLGPGALELKKQKKQIFLAAVRRTSIFRDVIWQASSEREADDVRANFGPPAKVRIAPVLVPEPDDGLTEQRELLRSPKERGSAEVVFVSRISPVKNLLAALGYLERIEGAIRLTIVGPAENLEYWAQCCRTIEALPSNVKVEYLGSVSHDEIHAILARHHLLLFPTFSENFGHVIAESLSSGTPVLISDQTPWRNLTALNAGWDLPLDRPEAFVQTLNEFLDLDDWGFRAMSKAARELAAEVVNNPATVEANRELFREALAVGATRQASPDVRRGRRTRNARDTLYPLLKRALDMVMATTLLVLLAPLLFTIGVGVFLTSGRPILFSQVRPGLNGAPFHLLKFRTMSVVAEGREQDAERITVLGAFLRQWSLDELPQLLNILKGEMSFVGPRPLLERYLPYYTPAERARFSVRPGITGWAQINGRNHLSWNDRLALDTWYVGNRSIGLDCLILIRTAGQVLKRNGFASDPESLMLNLDDERSLGEGALPRNEA